MAHVTTLSKAYSANTGTANTFSYSGSFETFKEVEVIVQLDGTNLTYQSGTINESASPREYTVNLTNKTIHIGGADLSSGTIKIFPKTDLDSATGSGSTATPTPRSTFTAGGSVTADNLNQNQKQVLRKLMEIDQQYVNANETPVFKKDISFEGATDDAYETTLTVVDPTADRTITLPNVTGTVITTGDTATVTATMMAADSVDSSELVDGSVDLSHLSANSVNSAKIVDGSIVNADINSSAAIAHSKLASITDGRILVGSGSNVPTAVAVSGDVTLANSGAVTIANDAVEQAMIADDAVGTDQLADNAVTIAKVGCEQTTISDSDSHIPTSGAVVDYVSGAITPLGGFEAIATEDVFPTTVPAAGVIISIADATEISVNSSGVSTNCRTDGNGSDNVTINGFPSILRGGVGDNADPYVLPASSGLLVVSTGSSHTYTYHRLIATTEDIKLLSDTVESFKARYRVASSAPGSDNNDGDIYYNTTNDTLYVYDGSQWEQSVTTTPGDDTVTGAKIVDDAIDSEHYTDGSIDHAHLANDCVDGDNIQDDVINSEHIAAGAVDLEHMSSESVDEDNLHISNAGSDGQFLSKQSGNSGGLTWASVTSTPEGEAILSTTNSNEASTKFLRADGDGTCSWQIPPDTTTPADDSVTGAKLSVSLVQGDVLYGSGTDTLARLAKGTAGKVLTMNSGATAPEWADAAGGGAVGGSTDKIFLENGQTVTTNYTIGTEFGAACNALSAGPITINSGVTVTIDSGDYWTIV